LGVVIEVIKSVEAIVREKGLTQVETVVLQIGELSSIVPKYIEACYPAAVDGTMLRESRLKIETLPGNAICEKCGKVFNLIQQGGSCPACGERDWRLLGGKEFVLKEIIAR
jgi:hydrogenase nickel incorporation protein HypA/HybF